MCTNSWIEQELGWTLEIDITYRCNLSCNHCNRFCNNEKSYNIKREHYDMKIEHIEFICSEIIRYPKGKIHLIRIIGGEPLLSPIIGYAVQMFEELLNLGFIEKILIVTNGTISIKKEIEKYVIFSPIELCKIYKENNRLLYKEEVYQVKNYKHRNLTVTPNDFNEKPLLCNRVLNCGINFSIYGFTYCAPCLPSLLMFPENHKRFLHYLPISLNEFISDNYENSVCNNCCFCLDNYQFKIDTLEFDSKEFYVGNSWKNQIEINKNNYFEPNTNWINI